MHDPRRTPAVQTSASYLLLRSLRSRCLLKLPGQQHEPGKLEDGDQDHPNDPQRMHPIGTFPVVHSGYSCIYVRTCQNAVCKAAIMATLSNPRRRHVIVVGRNTA